MPKLNTEESRDKFEKTIRDRLMYRAEKIDEALPGPKDEPIPEAQVFEQAGDAAEKDGRSDHLPGKTCRFGSRKTSQRCTRTSWIRFGNTRTQTDGFWGWGEKHPTAQMA